MESYPPLHTSANEVLCSHHHRDHDFVEAMELTPRGDSPFTVETVQAFHDDKEMCIRDRYRVLRGMSSSSESVAMLAPC